MSERRPESILAVDFGGENTRALLFDVVDGKYQLLAQRRGRTSIGAPRDDVAYGLARQLRDMSAATERRFFDEAGRLIKPERSQRVGLDYCLTTASAGESIRAAFLGLQPQISIDAAMRAAAPFYIEAVARLHLFDGMSDRARLNRIVDSRPELVILSGGADGGAKTAMLNLASLLRQALAAMTPGARPVIIYAGNRDLAATARETLGQLAEVKIAANIAPGENRMQLEPLKAALAEFYDEHRRRAASFQNIAAYSDSGILSTALGFERMTAFFARMQRKGVLGIDCGGIKSQMTLAQGGDARSMLRGDLGQGRGAAKLLDALGEETLRQWLPFEPRAGELKQAALKKGLRAADSLGDMRQRTIDYAFLRAGIYGLLSSLDGGELSDVGLIITAGAALAGVGQGALDMLLLADALPIAGVVEVKCDRFGVLPALGALAAIEPAVAVHALEGGAVEHVGSLVRATGSLAAGMAALQLTISLSSGESVKREVVAGDVWHLPLSVDESAEIRLSAARGVAVAGKRRLRLRLAGGRGGILFDARLAAQKPDAPLTERAINMLRWFAAAAGDDQPVMIPESWLLRSED